MTQSVLTIKDIKTLIPHRYPMLLVDKIHSIEGSESCVGIKNVTMNEPFFQGHFPDEPIMPGVLIVEAMAQTAGAMVSADQKIGGGGTSVYFMSIEEAKFRKPVVPGDVMEMHIQKIQSRGAVWKYEGKAMVDGKVHAQAKFTAMIVHNKDSE